MGIQRSVFIQHLDRDPLREVGTEIRSRQDTTRTIHSPKRGLNRSQVGMMKLIEGKPSSSTAQD